MLHGLKQTLLLSKPGMTENARIMDTSLSYLNERTDILRITLKPNPSTVPVDLSPTVIKGFLGFFYIVFDYKWHLI